MKERQKVWNEEETQIVGGNEKREEEFRGRFHQTFLPSKKLPVNGVWQKYLKFNFINKVVRLKLSQNLPNYVCHAPNTVRQKRCRILSREFFARKCWRNWIQVWKKEEIVWSASEVQPTVWSSWDHCILVDCFCSLIHVTTEARFTKLLTQIV